MEPVDAHLVHLAEVLLVSEYSMLWSLSALYSFLEEQHGTCYLLTFIHYGLVGVLL